MVPLQSENELLIALTDSPEPAIQGIYRQRILQLT